MDRSLLIYTNPSQALEHACFSLLPLISQASLVHFHRSSAHSSGTKVIGSKLKPLWSMHWSVLMLCTEPQIAPEVVSSWMCVTDCEWPKMTWKKVKSIFEFFIPYYSALAVWVCVIGRIYTLHTNFCIKWALFSCRMFLVILFGCAGGNNAGDDKLSDRPEHTSGGGCREVILIVLGLRTSVRTHMFM